MHNYHFVDATEALVKNFNENLIIGSKKFRYFKTRPYSVINHHLTTQIILNAEQTPVAYGHLEREANNLWLGLAVADAHHRRGLGSMMLQQLISCAKNSNEAQIKLSVDVDNKGARVLYEQEGFTLKEKRGEVLIYTLSLN